MPIRGTGLESTFGRLAGAESFTTEMPWGKVAVFFTIACYTRSETRGRVMNCIERQLTRDFIANPLISRFSVWVWFGLAG